MKSLELNREGPERKKPNRSRGWKRKQMCKTGDGGRRQQAGQIKTFYQYKHELPQGQVRPSASVLVDILQNPLSQEAMKKRRNGRVWNSQCCEKSTSSCLISQFVFWILPCRNYHIPIKAELVFKDRIEFNETLQINGSNTLVINCNFKDHQRKASDKINKKWTLN